MKLRDYLLQQGIKQEDFADLLDVGRTHLSCIINNKRRPGKKLARRIEEATNGAISAESCRDGSALGYEGKSRRVTETIQQVPPRRRALSLF